MRNALSLLLLTPLLAGCPNTDAAVFVEPTVEAPTLAVSKGLLGTSIQGSFKLSLHLGARASGASDVTAPVFKIEDAKGAATITEVTSFVTTDKPFPIHVEPDSTVDIAVSFASGTDPIPSDLTTKLCDAAGITIGGSIKDSLEFEGSPLSSEVFHASGCM